MGRNPAPPKKPWNDDSPVNTNKLMVSTMVSFRGAKGISQPPTETILSETSPGPWPASFELPGTRAWGSAINPLSQREGTEDGPKHAPVTPCRPCLHPHVEIKQVQTLPRSAKAGLRVSLPLGGGGGLKMPTPTDLTEKMKRGVEISPHHRSETLEGFDSPV